MQQIQVGIEGSIQSPGQSETRVIVLEESGDDGFSLIGWKPGATGDYSKIRFICRFPTKTDLTDFIQLSRWQVTWPQ